MNEAIAAEPEQMLGSNLRTAKSSAVQSSADDRSADDSSVDDTGPCFLTMVFAWVFLDYSSTLIAAQTLPGKLALACFSEQQTE